MRTFCKVINGVSRLILDVVILDEDDIDTLSKQFSSFSAIRLELNALGCLDLFPCVNTLILTGGMPSPEGLEALYKHTELENLVLDYEETDSDSDGIDITCFPKLQYLLTRSNLNVIHLPDISPQIRCEVVNEYGKKREIRVSPWEDILHDARMFFFSTEASSPAGPMLINILKEVELSLNRENARDPFSQKLDRIGIIPICMTKELIKNGFGKQRKYVSLKKQFADIRLQIPYAEFVHSTSEKRRQLCRQNILDAAECIAAKDDSLQKDRLAAAINLAFDRMHQ